MVIFFSNFERTFVLPFSHCWWKYLTWFKMDSFLSAHAFSLFPVTDLGVMVKPIMAGRKSGRHMHLKNVKGRSQQLSINQPHLSLGIGCAGTACFSPRLHGPPSNMVTPVENGCLNQGAFSLWEIWAWWYILVNPSNPRNLTTIWNLRPV